MGHESRFNSNVVGSYSNGGACTHQTQGHGLSLAECWYELATSSLGAVNASYLKSLVWKAMSSMHPNPSINPYIRILGSLRVTVQNASLLLNNEHATLMSRLSCVTPQTCTIPASLIRSVSHTRTFFQLLESIACKHPQSVPRIMTLPSSADAMLVRVDVKRRQRKPLGSPLFPRSQILNLPPSSMLAHVRSFCPRKQTSVTGCV
mmetsp:Transcript_56653/g.90020  ORF Transcript_56653/g.90020 Transcript_56653/m.90020 type:complete len:205 (+) Transcript_56653:3734-4348(+)